MALSQVWVLVPFALVALTGCLGSTGPEIGKQAPGFTLPSTTGTDVSLQGLRGKVVLLDFMGSRCVSCVHQMPALLDADHKYHNASFVLVSVDNTVATPGLGGRFMSDLVKFQREFEANWTFVQDEREESVGLDYQIVSLPTLFLVMTDGEIAMKHTGLASFACLDRAIQAALEDPAGSPRPRC